MNAFSLRITLLAIGAGFAATGIAQDKLGELKPRAAEIAVKTEKNLMLGIARAGERLVAVGDRGGILVSDKGSDWKQAPTPVHSTLTAVSFADDKTGWAVGHDLAILHTGDGGSTWTLQYHEPTQARPWLGVLALDAQRAYAVGAYGAFMATVDGGTTWTAVTAPALLDDGLHLNSIIRLGNGDLFVAGETGLLGVLDGQTWRRLRLPYDGSLFGALPRGERGALVFGLRGNAFVTSDVRSGQWTRLNTGTVQSLFGGARLDNGEAVLVGSDGAVLVVGADNKVRTGAKAEGAATYSGVLSASDGLWIAGETGLSRQKL